MCPPVAPVAEVGDLGGSFPNLRGQRPRLQCLRLPLPPVAEVGDLGCSFPNHRGQRPRLQCLHPSNPRGQRPRLQCHRQTSACLPKPPGSTPPATRPAVAKVGDLGLPSRTSGVDAPGYNPTCRPRLIPFNPPGSTPPATMPAVAKGGDLGLPFPNLRGQRPRLQCPL
jgi:hypothetical protein